MQTNKFSLTNIFVGALVSVFALGAMFSFATPAKAQTVDELMALIATLQAQIAALSGGSSVVTSAPAVTYSHSVTLRSGMKGPQVASLQAALNAAGFPVGNADGSFGPMTATGVQNFQMSKGFTADAVVGPATATALNAHLAAMAPTVVQPPVEQPEQPTTPTLNGGAGALEDADFVSSINNEEVGEGESDVVVIALDLEADNGSDLALTSVRVEFEQAAGQGGSDDFDDYADEVTVWFEGKQVGSVSVDDMNESSGVWSSNIAVASGAVIEEGEEAELSVAVSALNNIDSSDLGAGDGGWEARIANVRYMDAQGAIMTESGLGDLDTDRGFLFDSFISAADVSLTVDETNDTPEEASIEVDEDGGSEVTLLIGELEAEGADIEITELAVEITSAGTGSPDDIASRFFLIIDGEEVASINSDECTGTANGNDPDEECDGTEASGTPTLYIFDDFEFTVDEGETVEFEIVAELNEISVTFVAGDSLTADVDADDIVAEAEGEDLAAGDLDGTADGETQSFYEDGFSAMLNNSSSVTVNGNVAAFKFVVDITAFGDADVDLTIADFNYTVDGPAGNTANEDVTLGNEDNNVDEDTPGTFTWNDESGKITFTVFIETPGAGDVGVYNVTLDDVDGEVVDEDLETYISYSS